MAEKFKDAEDRLLESLLRAEPIDDAGFSDRIVARIRRTIWVRRLALPVAMLVGSAIAVKPLLQLGSVFAAFGGKLPGVSIVVPAAMATQLPMLLTIGSVMLIAVFLFRLSEE